MSHINYSQQNGMPEISKRDHIMPPSPIRKLTPFADEAKKRGINIYHVNIGQPDLPTPQPMIDAVNNYSAGVVAYTPSNGDPEYRQALFEYYGNLGIELAPSELIITTAGSEAIIFSFMACADPGDEIITFEPFYANYAGFAVMAGVNLVPVLSRISNGFALPKLSAVEDKLTSRTRAILLCNPNNPTGYVYSEEELKALGQLAKKHDLFIIVDEVYREFVYDGHAHKSVMSIPELKDHAIMIDSISKRFNACGARVGSIASRRGDFMNLVNRFAQARLCPPAVAQKMALAALKMPPAYLNEAREEYKNRRDSVFKALGKIKNINFHRSPGSFYTVVELPIDDTEDFARWLLTDFQHKGETVMVAPAQGFYKTPKAGLKQIRIAYVLNSEKMERAIELLGLGLSAYMEKADKK